MPDGDAIRPGDIITSMSGQTIEIVNTDAEDGLFWPMRSGTRRRPIPATIIDLATLTGAIIVAWRRVAGSFHNDNSPSSRRRGEASGEGLAHTARRGYDKMIDPNSLT